MTKILSPAATHQHTLSSNTPKASTYQTSNLQHLPGIEPGADEPPIVNPDRNQLDSMRNATDTNEPVTLKKAICENAKKGGLVGLAFGAVGFLAGPINGAILTVGFGAVGGIIGAITGALKFACGDYSPEAMEGPERRHPNRTTHERSVETVHQQNTNTDGDRQGPSINALTSAAFSAGLAADILSM